MPLLRCGRLAGLDKFLSLKTKWYLKYIRTWEMGFINQKQQVTSGFVTMLLT